MTYDQDYEAHVQAWGRQVAKEVGIDVPGPASFYIESRDPDVMSGCPTCGHGGDRGGMDLIMDLGPLRRVTVTSFPFSDINVMLKGIWEAQP